MGNAAVTIHHPTSLDHGKPYLEAGKVESTTTSMIRLEKRDSAAVGCGGRIIFKKNVKDSEWTYRINKQISSNFEIGSGITVKAADKSAAIDQLAVKFGMSSSETQEGVTLIKSKISDCNAYSELYCYVDYNGANCGRYNWVRNDLNLKATHKWEANSEMVIDINFRK